MERGEGGKATRVVDCHRVELCQLRSLSFEALDDSTRCSE
jgi:hypothetical protein